MAVGRSGPVASAFGCACEKPFLILTAIYPFHGGNKGRLWQWVICKNFVSIGCLISGLDERLFAAARDDNEDLLLEVFSKGNFDINAKDGWASNTLSNEIMIDKNP